MARKIILLALRTALAWTFIHAGVLKIWDFRHVQPATPDFVIAIQQFKLLPWPDATVLLAVYLPWVEIFVALGLFIPRVRSGAALTITALTTVFIGALASAWARGLSIDCGCFGHDDVSTDYRMLLLRDVLILAAALFFLFRDARQASSGDHATSGEGERFTLP